MIKIKVWDTVKKEMSIGMDLYTLAGYLTAIHPNLGNETFLRYTGVESKDGTDIYEGDFVTRFCTDPNCPIEHKGVVTWSDEWAVWGIQEPESNRTNNYMAPLAFGSPSHEVQFGVTILGNIYENPELYETPNNS